MERGSTEHSESEDDGPESPPPVGHRVSRNRTIEYLDSDSSESGDFIPHTNGSLESILITVLKILILGYLIIPLHKMLYWNSMS